MKDKTIVYTQDGRLVVECDPFRLSRSIPEGMDILGLRSEAQNIISKMELPQPEEGDWLL